MHILYGWIWWFYVYSMISWIVHNNLESVFTKYICNIKCLYWQGEITKGYRKLAKKWHPDMASKAEVGWFLIISLVLYTKNTESRLGKWRMNQCLVHNKQWCSVLFAYTSQKYFKMIWKNSEECTRSSPYGMQTFHRLFCLFNAFSNICACNCRRKRSLQRCFRK